MKFNKSLSDITTDVRESIKIIADNMIKTRPRSEVVYRPYRKNEIYYDPEMWFPRKIDLKKLYPDAKKGNIVYIGSVFESVADYDAKICMIGNAVVIIDGKIVHDYEDNPSENRRSSCPIKLKKGANPVLFMVRCDDDNKFEFEFMPAVNAFWFWATDYILHVRATSPIDDFKGEDGIGISKLYESEQPFDGEYVYPEINRNSGFIDFNEIFPDADGVCAYALTTAMSGGRLGLKANCRVKVTVNGQDVLPSSFKVKQGDIILVKAMKSENWGFEFDENADIGLPFLESSRQFGDKWVTLGTFGRGDCYDIPYGPELSIQFVNPYRTENWGKTFWKLNSKDDYVRPYLDSCFFGQWFYALMVGQFGLLQAAKTLNNAEYVEYFADGMQIMAEFYDYTQYDNEMFGMPTFLQRCVELWDLDSIGTMGMNFCELYKISPSPEVLYCIEVLAKAAKENIPRFEDGTYCRPKDMWADDTFMSCPFLVRLGLVKKDRYYFEEVVRQLLGFKKRLWMADKKLFSHIFFLNTQVPNRIPWGRGNGWVFVTLSDVLENMPEDVDGRDELLELYKEFAEGISALQDKDGLWHQVLTRADSYQETSCSGMFLLGMCRGVRNGWLGDEYREKIEKAYNGLMKHKVDCDGNIYDVCRGSGNSMDEDYYANLAVIDNDDHGTGIILTALSEMAKLL